MTGKETVSNTEETTLCGRFFYRIAENDNWSLDEYRDRQDQKIYICGEDLPSYKGVYVNLTGTWSEFRGRKQLNVSRYNFAEQSDRSSFVSFMSHMRVGIGQAYANRIYDKFGTESYKIVTETPERLSEAISISPERIEKIREKIAENNLLFLLQEAFGGLITIDEAEKYRKYFGKNALQAAKNDPYTLCEISGFSFNRVDRIAYTLGVPSTAPNRLSRAIHQAFFPFLTMGHTCVPKDEFFAGVLRTVNCRKPNDVSKAVVQEALNDAAKRGDIVCTRDMVYDALRAKQEKTVAKILSEISSTPVENDRGVEVEQLIAGYESKNHISLADEQKEAVQCVMKNRASIITGGPGTGKSTIIKTVLFVHQQLFGQDSSPLLLAPTGRAARRMKEVTGYEASTIHKALSVRVASAEEELTCGRESLDSNLIIVDEFSMSDLSVTYCLLEHLPEDATIVFVGDADQLPSVGYGNVLADLINSESIPTIRLNKIFRQEKDNLVIENAQRVKNGNPSLVTGDDFKVWLCQEQNMIEKVSQWYCGCVDKYGIDNVLLLCPYREKGRVNVSQFNTYLQQVLVPKQENQEVMRVNGVEFRIGDRVMQTKNTNSLANGDIGTIKAIGKKILPDTEKEVLSVEIEFDGKIHSFNHDKMKTITLAYCMSVHKSQGNEAKIVIMVITNEHTALLQRSVFYTGMTRAKEKVLIVTDNQDIIYKCVRNNKRDHRYSLLAKRLVAAKNEHQDKTEK